MRASIVAALFLISACASVQGAEKAPPAFTTPETAPTASTSAAGPVAVDLPAGAYRLDPRHATVLFRIRHMDLAWFTARFERKDATFELDPADPTRSRLTASVETASVNTG